MDSKTNAEYIITIGRQYGSAGLEIGRRVAEAMGVKCYNEELLVKASEESGMCKELFETHDEKLTNSFLYSLVMDTFSIGYSSSMYADMPIDHKVFLAQFETIKKLAAEGPCVIVGRCADYALEEFDNCVNVFIHAAMHRRIRRIARIHDLTDAKAKDAIVKKDKKRAAYYNYYSNKKWGEAKEYDLCLDSGVIGIEGAVEMILQFCTHKKDDKETITL